MNAIEPGKKALQGILEKNGNTPINTISPDALEFGERVFKDLVEKHGTKTMKSLNTVTFKDELRDAFPVFNDEIDTTFLLELLYYFPIEKTYISAGTYDQYLYDLEKTIIDNYDAGNFQVSFFYAHLIFMSYAYHCLELAYSIWPDKIKDQYEKRYKHKAYKCFFDVKRYHVLPPSCYGTLYQNYHIIASKRTMISSFSIASLLRPL